MLSATYSFLRRLPAHLCAAALFFAPVSGRAQQSYVMAHHVPEAVSSGQARLVDLMPGAQRMQIALHLPLRNQAELEQLIQRLYDPQSPDYHHFLSVQEFTEQFGPTHQDYDA